MLKSLSKLVGESDQTWLQSCTGTRKPVERSCCSMNGEQDRDVRLDVAVIGLRWALARVGHASSVAMLIGDDSRELSRDMTC